MANRNFYPSQSGGSARVYLDFELLGAGASALTLSFDAAQWVASVSRSGVGVYVVTMKDAWTRCLFKAADMDDTANDGAYATVSDLTNENTATPLKFTIRTRNAGGTATECAAARRVGVALILRNGNWGIT
jgi:hypothetical protein